MRLQVELVENGHGETGAQQTAGSQREGRAAESRVAGRSDRYKTPDTLPDPQTLAQTLRLSLKDTGNAFSRS